jgi:hypothetical protein
MNRKLAAISQMMLEKILKRTEGKTYERALESLYKDYSQWRLNRVLPYLIDSVGPEVSFSRSQDIIECNFWFVLPYTMSLFYKNQ